MAEEPTPRGFLSAGLDYLGSRFLNLPPEKCGYTTQAVRVPMRDGVELAADLYLPQLPEGQDAAGLIMVQCCYGRDAGIAFVNARVFAARGFKVLFVSTRGTYGSGGEFWPGRAEQSDSQDIVVWMRQQPWYPGTFATAGASYLGYSQWAFLRDPPEDCVAAAIMVAPHDQARDEKKSILSNASHIPGLRFLGGRSPLTETIASLPLYSSLEKYFSERKAPWLFDYLDHPNLDDEYWTAVRHHDSLERVNIPILLISGWYDPFFTQSMAQYKRLHERGVDVKLIVGPWTHTQASGLYSMRELLEFFSEHLAKSGKYSTAPAHIYVTGAEEWTPMPSWPPATTPQTFYLQPNGTLGPDQPAEDARSLSFVFDPLSPTPALGGPNDDWRESG
ncbi:hypothetical protein N7468_007306 [Penicillium chermesinum]|uniref:Xaa-Pro dipeptidyl-peptidase-like domain-containing protein n=1 Tax=Penicillium chermesinum TaxID=63820 RepID=A0A9W9NTU5_9EURO|nr:uncharacterized protein N7468_007306 [Penicillium chermesinum]KAJ5226081.1 hypothetical protein N7468_007306 [Penicillium chermesinum]